MDKTGRRVRVVPWCACGDPACDPDRAEVVYDDDGDHLLFPLVPCDTCHGEPPPEGHPDCDGKGCPTCRCSAACWGGQVPDLDWEAAAEAFARTPVMGSHRGNARAVVAAALNLGVD